VERTAAEKRTAPPDVMPAKAGIHFDLAFRATFEEQDGFPLSRE
jgi:hypothetical protein